MRARAQNVVRAGDLELRFLVDEIHGLDDEEVLKLACLGPEELSAQTFPVCFGELARRVNA